MTIFENFTRDFSFLLPMNIPPKTTREAKFCTWPFLKTKCSRASFRFTEKKTLIFSFSVSWNDCKLCFASGSELIKNTQKIYSFRYKFLFFRSLLKSSYLQFLCPVFSRIRFLASVNTRLATRFVRSPRDPKGWEESQTFRTRALSKITQLNSIVKFIIPLNSMIKYILSLEL